jgi:peptide/nickel transport system ATP-binding protein
MDLVQELAVEHEMGILMISHDLGVIRRQAQRVLVLQQGHLVESNETEQLFDTPRHPYTRALLGMSLHGTNHPPLTRIPVPVDVSEGVQP